LRYGKPLEITHHLGANGFLALGSKVIAEVCLVLQQPSGLLLATSKPFYPQGSYRLPTRSIEPGETVMDALERGARDEFGLEAHILRYLAHITYLHNEGRLFHSYVFLLRADDSLNPSPRGEPSRRLHQVSGSDLVAAASALEQLPADFSRELGSTWADWGRFRAVAHRVAAQALSET